MQQPLLVDSPHDMDNNHERRRSQEVINCLLKNNPEEKADKDIRTARGYTFGMFA